MTEAHKISEAAEFLCQNIGSSSKLAIVLGSGLASIAEKLSDSQAVPYSEIPHWPVSSVSGHAGGLISGRLAGVPVLLLAGRVHLYEGFTPGEVVFGVRVLAKLGLGTLILTNAAGGIRDDLDPGSVVLITDHINLQFASPLTGAPRFIDLTEAYDRLLGEVARKSAASISLNLQEGVYAAVAGPQYETPAEVRFLQAIGADMVGMSTVIETIAARESGTKVLAFSVIANRAAGLSEGQLSHDEVLETGAKAANDLTRLLAVVVGEIK